MDQNNMYTDWYELWMKQSKAFFESADKNLKDVFAKGASMDPQENLQQINDWLENLKKQWEFSQLTEEQQMYASYWKMMGKMCNDASDLMVQQWTKRAQENKPIQNVQELYELWLNCCSEVYKKSLNSTENPYSDFMNAALKFWKSGMPK